MFKKRIKAFVMSCVLVCTLPVISNAMEPDDFLQFLVESAYPEVKENSETDNKVKNSNENNDKKEDEYIKFHIGEENIPEVNENNELKETSNENKEEKTTSSSNSRYNNDIRITKENPRILLYHTHAGETYYNSPEGNYHSKDRPNSVLAVGELLTDELEEKGWGVVHSTKYHDYPDFTASYASSLKTIKEMLPNYKSIDIAIDLHRDGRDLNSESAKQKEHDRMTTSINGESVAKIFFVVGQKNENVAEVRKLAQDLTNFANRKYPGIALPVVEKTYGKYNQYMAKNHMLVEVGSNGTTSEEAKATTKYLAEILDEYFKTK